MKEQLFAYLDTRSQEMNEMADAIFTHPETAHNEYFARRLEMAMGRRLDFCASMMR